ncbi:putative Aspartyl/asparaginyl beta-hydroxylase [Blattamonas nauphoetae]|uniref:Aspartyl/asparaginyl beta-hydroxylase n=1 Tax=Blattamonas nauphoetae TaxID=2049346 RepID=A0ABQ9YK55_9EUKA|nr:putative Aspartyl/asparaginyl beta-hydroxylase [Blattamonas nauphoetae]
MKKLENPLLTPHPTQFAETVQPASIPALPLSMPAQQKKCRRGESSEHQRSPSNSSDSSVAHRPQRKRHKTQTKHERKTPSNPHISTSDHHNVHPSSTEQTDSSTTEQKKPNDIHFSEVQEPVSPVSVLPHLTKNNHKPHHRQQPALQGEHLNSEEGKDRRERESRKEVQPRKEENHQSQPVFAPKRVERSHRDIISDDHIIQDMHGDEHTGSKSLRDETLNTNKGIDLKEDIQGREQDDISPIEENSGNREGSQRDNSERGSSTQESSDESDNQPTAELSQPGHEILANRRPTFIETKEETTTKSQKTENLADDSDNQQLQQIEGAGDHTSQEHLKDHTPSKQIGDNLEQELHEDTLTAGRLSERERDLVRTKSSSPFESEDSISLHIHTSPQIPERPDTNEIDQNKSPSIDDSTIQQNDTEEHQTQPAFTQERTERSPQNIISEGHSVQEADPAEQTPRDEEEKQEDDNRFERVSQNSSCLEDGGVNSETIRLDRKGTQTPRTDNSLITESVRVMDSHQNQSQTDDDPFDSKRKSPPIIHPSISANTFGEDHTSFLPESQQHVLIQSTSTSQAEPLRHIRKSETENPIVHAHNDSTSRPKETSTRDSQFTSPPSKSQNRTDSTQISLPTQLQPKRHVSSPSIPHLPLRQQQLSPPSGEETTLPESRQPPTFFHSSKEPSRKASTSSKTSSDSPSGQNNPETGDISKPESSKRRHTEHEKILTTNIVPHLQQSATVPPLFYSQQETDTSSQSQFQQESEDLQSPPLSRSPSLHNRGSPRTPPSIARLKAFMKQNAQPSSQSPSEHSSYQSPVQSHETTPSSFRLRSPSSHNQSTASPSRHSIHLQSSPSLPDSPPHSAAHMEQLRRNPSSLRNEESKTGRKELVEKKRQEPIDMIPNPPSLTLLGADSDYGRGGKQVRPLSSIKSQPALSSPEHPKSKSTTLRTHHTAYANPQRSANHSPHSSPGQTSPRVVSQSPATSSRKSHPSFLIVPLTTAPEQSHIKSSTSSVQSSTHTSQRPSHSSSLPRHVQVVVHHPQEQKSSTHPSLGSAQSDPERTSHRGSVATSSEVKKDSILIDQETLRFYTSDTPESHQTSPHLSHSRHSESPSNTSHSLIRSQLQDSSHKSTEPVENGDVVESGYTEQILSPLDQSNHTKDPTPAQGLSESFVLTPSLTASPQHPPNQSTTSPLQKTPTPSPDMLSRVSSEHPESPTHDQMHDLSSDVSSDDSSSEEIVGLRSQPDESSYSLIIHLNPKPTTSSFGGRHGPGSSLADPKADKKKRKKEMKRQERAIGSVQSSIQRQILGETRRVPATGYEELGMLSMIDDDLLKDADAEIFGDDAPTRERRVLPKIRFSNNDPQRSQTPSKEQQENEPEMTENKAKDQVIVEVIQEKEEYGRNGEIEPKEHEEVDSPHQTDSAQTTADTPISSLHTSHSSLHSVSANPVPQIHYLSISVDPPPPSDSPKSNETERNRKTTDQELIHTHPAIEESLIVDQVTTDHAAPLQNERPSSQFGNIKVVISKRTRDNETEKLIQFEQLTTPKHHVEEPTDEKEEQPILAHAHDQQVHQSEDDWDGGTISDQSVSTGEEQFAEENGKKEYNETKQKENETKEAEDRNGDLSQNIPEEGDITGKEGSMKTEQTHELDSPNEGKADKVEEKEDVQKEDKQVDESVPKTEENEELNEELEATERGEEVKGEEKQDMQEQNEKADILSPELTMTTNIHNEERPESVSEQMKDNRKKHLMIDPLLEETKSPIQIEMTVEQPTRETQEEQKSEPTDRQVEDPQPNSIKGDHDQAMLEASLRVEDPEDPNREPNGVVEDKLADQSPSIETVVVIEENDAKHCAEENSEEEMKENKEEKKGNEETFNEKKDIEEIDKEKEDSEEIAKEKEDTEEIVDEKKEDSEEIAKEKEDTEEIVDEKEDCEEIEKEKEDSEEIAKEKEDTEEIVDEKEDCEEIEKEKEDSEEIAKEKEDTEEIVDEKEDCEEIEKEKEDTEEIEKEKEDSEEIAKEKEDTEEIVDEKEDCEEIEKEKEDTEEIEKEKEDTEEIVDEKEDTEEIEKEKEDSEEIAKEKEDTEEIVDEKEDTEEIEKEKEDTEEIEKEKEDTEEIVDEKEDTEEIEKEKEDTEEIEKEKEDAEEIVDEKKDTEEIEKEKEDTEEIEKEKEDTEEIVDEKEDTEEIEKEKEDTEEIEKEKEDAEEIVDEKEDTEEIEKEKEDCEEIEKEKEDTEEIVDEKEDTEEIEKEKEDTEEIEKEKEDAEEIVDEKKDDRKKMEDEKDEEDGKMKAEVGIHPMEKEEGILEEKKNDGKKDGEKEEDRKTTDEDIVEEKEDDTKSEVERMKDEEKREHLEKDDEDGKTEERKTQNISKDDIVEENEGRQKEEEDTPQTGRKAISERDVTREDEKEEHVEEEIPVQKGENYEDEKKCDTKKKELKEEVYGTNENESEEKREEIETKDLKNEGSIKTTDVAQTGIEEEKEQEAADTQPDEMGGGSQKTEDIKERANTPEKSEQTEQKSEEELKDEPETAPGATFQTVEKTIDAQKDEPTPLDMEESICVSPQTHNQTSLDQNDYASIQNEDDIASSSTLSQSPSSSSLYSSSSDNSSDLEYDPVRAQQAETHILQKCGVVSGFRGEVVIEVDSFDTDEESPRDTWLSDREVQDDSIPRLSSPQDTQPLHRYVSVSSFRKPSGLFNNPPQLTPHSPTTPLTTNTQQQRRVRVKMVSKEGANEKTLSVIEIENDEDDENEMDDAKLTEIGTEIATWMTQESMEGKVNKLHQRDISH